MSEVVTLGECLVTLVAGRPGPLADATSFDRFVAGAEANVAVGLVRLGHAVTYIGRVGNDGFGEAIRRQLRGEGVDTAFLTTEPAAPNGLMIREHPGLVPAQVLYYRRDSAGSRVSAADVDAAVRAFETLRLQDEPRPAFVAKYARTNINSAMANEIIAVGTASS